jgi:hypothetical protein
MNMVVILNPLGRLLKNIKHSGSGSAEYFIHLLINYSPPPKAPPQKRKLPNDRVCTG